MPVVIETYHELSMSRKLSIVAVGAHMDDCWLGMGGVALKAVRAGHRVTMVQAVSQYGAWPVVAGREAEIKPPVQQLADDAGIGLILLGHDYLRLQNNPALVDELAGVLDELKPDILFCHWEDDNNQDHVALGEASRIAAIHGACFLPHPPSVFHVPAEIYRYRVDCQARNFAPDIFTDVTDVLYDLLERCALFDRIYARHIPSAVRHFSVVDHRQEDREVELSWHTEQKFASCLLNGYECGARFAEGFRVYKGAAAGSSLLGSL